MRKLILLLLVLLFTPMLVWAVAGCDGAGNCYVRAGATGSGNRARIGRMPVRHFLARAALPAAAARGVTFWVAVGNYGGVTFSSAASGATVTTVESATSANHGPSRLE